MLAGLSDRRHRVGDRPGMAQAMKLANNFLSATTLAATSEAIAFGRSAGLDMATMLDVLNGSSGRSAATTDKFPEHVLTGRYASGFTNSLMAKDVQLYLGAVAEPGGSVGIGAVTAVDVGAVRRRPSPASTSPASTRSSRAPEREVGRPLARGPVHGYSLVTTMPFSSRAFSEGKGCRCPRERSTSRCSTPTTTCTRRETR